MDQEIKESDKKETGRGRGIFLFVGTSVALFGGFLVTKRTEEQLVSPEFEPPTKFALRALKWATLLSLSGAGLLCGGVCWYLDVWSIPEFSTRMNQMVPPIFQSIDSRFPKTILKHQYGVLNPNKPQSQDIHCQTHRDEND